MRNPSITERQKSFCMQYLIDGNGTQAAIRAGYSPGSAKVTASRMLTKANVRAYLSELQAGVVARFEADADTVLERLWGIATADVNELVAWRVWNCRYCHGTGHLFQWRTQRELEAAQAAFDAARANGKPTATPSRPDDRGGFGFRGNVAPNPDCPECDGLGVGRVVMGDTTRLSPEALLLYNGIRVGADGQVQILLADRSRALVQIARILGMFQPKAEVSFDEKVQVFLQDIMANGSKAPLAVWRDDFDGSMH